MTIRRDDVLHAAKLSRLALEEAEVSAIAADLERIVGYVEQLMTVDVEGVEPMIQPLPSPAARRSDEPHAVLGHAALAGAAVFHEGLVGVPKVIE